MKSYTTVLVPWFMQYSCVFICLCVCQALHVKSLDDVDTATQSVQTTANATRSITVQITPASRSKGRNHFESQSSN